MYAVLLAGLFVSATPASNDFQGTCAFPGLVQNMLRWPDRQLLDGPQRVRPPKVGNFGPLEHSLGWMQTILDPNWVPLSSAKDEMIFVRAEYGRLSASHVRWERNGFKIQVAQTRAIIVIKLVPISVSDNPPATQEEMESYAKDLCMRLFTDSFTTTFRKRPMDEPLRVEGIRATIAEYSFDCALKRPVDGGLAAAAWKPEFFPLGSKAPSHPASHMWWHYLGWYTDGKTVAFWTFKIAGDSWWCPPACIADPIGGKWF
jgi:hypothetical protein